MKEENLEERNRLNKSFSGIWSGISINYRYLVLTSINIMLLILFSIFIKIHFLLDTPWITVMIYIFFTPLLIYSISIMFRPAFVFIIIFLGLTLGEILFCIIYGCGGEFPFYLISRLLSQGAAALIISSIRKKNEVLAMISGGIWMFIGLFLISYIYYVLILNWGSDYIIIYSILFGGINFAFIPLSILINKILRIVFKVKYLEDLIRS